MADSDKSQAATPRRRQKAREKGQVARSRDLSNVFACAAAAGVFVWQGAASIQHWRQLFRSTLDASSTPAGTNSGSLLFWTLATILRCVAPPLLAAWVAATIVSVSQGGLSFSAESLTFKAERMNPAAKIKQMFSLTGLSGVLKSLLPFSAILYIAYAVGRDYWGALMETSLIGFGGFVRLVCLLLFEIGWKSGMVLLIWAGIDYFLNWRKLEGDLKMSHQDLRDELKDTDGNPAVKTRIRRLRRQMRNRQMLKAVPKATVVVTNPTHFAVAIQYEPNMAAPIVLAKGRDFLAQKIKEIARWNLIPIMENPPLAQALFRVVEVGQAIPTALYAAVAEILAFVFHAQTRARTIGKKAGAPMPRSSGVPAYASRGVTP